ncbi:MAG: VOC family protein [Caulobacter sp.]|nr:VOC family protein [Caulobacter sp.]
MASVLGVGGVFFKADDVDAVRGWYRDVLGFVIEDWGGAMFPHPPSGYTVWSPFKADTGYFAPSTQPFMINLIVDDLDGVLARAAGHGVEPLGREDSDPSGRFAWLLDPAGIRIELWQPPAGA